MLNHELKIITGDELSSLLFHIDQLPYREARLLEAELKETYHQCLEKWIELDTLVKQIKSKRR